MSRGPHYSEHEDAIVKQMKLAGHTPKEIAKFIKRSPGSVYERLKRLGLAVATPRRVQMEREEQLEPAFWRRPSDPRRFSWEDQA